MARMSHDLYCIVLTNEIRDFQRDLYRRMDAIYGSVGVEKVVVYMEYSASSLPSIDYTPFLV